MAHPADKSDKQVREGTEALQNIADDVADGSAVKRTIEGQEHVEDMQHDDDPADSDDEPTERDGRPVEKSVKRSSMGAYGRLGKGQNG